VSLKPATAAGDTGNVIGDAEVSVVVQGPATPALPVTVASVRRWLPRAQLIVSTWAGSDVAGLDVDELVLSDDPGSTPYLDAERRPSERMFNTNRMFTSTKAGLAPAERDYAIKLRNDTPLRSAAVLDWFGDRSGRGPAEQRLFGQRIVMPNIAVRPADGMREYLFHPSDIVHIGRREDLIRLWDTEPIDEVENAGWFLDRPRPDPDLLPQVWSRYFNEQMLWLGALRRGGIEVDYRYAGHYSPELRVASELSLVTNFDCVEPWQIGVQLPFDDVVRQFPTWQYAWRNEWNRVVDRLCG
jgi:hypothetical protein